MQHYQALIQKRFNILDILPHTGGKLSLFADKIGTDEIHFWCTSAGNEIDFVLSDNEKLKAIEVKYDNNQVNLNKYKFFPKIILIFRFNFFG